MAVANFSVLTFTGKMASVKIIGQWAVFWSGTLCIWRQTSVTSTANFYCC